MLIVIKQDFRFKLTLKLFKISEDKLFLYKFVTEVNVLDFFAKNELLAQGLAEIAEAY